MTAIDDISNTALTVDWAGFGPHRPLGDTGWKVWSAGLLRTAGFAVSGLDWTAGDAAAAAGADRETFTAAYDAATAAESAALARLAGDEALRTAIVWQNRTVFSLLDKLADGSLPDGQKRRRRERSLAMYWQRYCGKAETIGFFGPAAWVPVGDTGEAITCRPGPGLVARRRVFLERWMVAELGVWMADQPGARWWFPPILRPDVHLDGDALLVPGRGPMRLRAGEADVLALADGRRHGQDIADALGVERAQVEKTLSRYHRQRLLLWDANIAVNDRAEVNLRARVDRIGDPDLFVTFDAVLRRLADAREAVEPAATSAELTAALDGLNAAFVEITGMDATREGGKMYAGRTLSYHDATRDVAMAVGRDFLDRISRPLALVADAADWFGNRVAELVEQEVTELVRGAAARSKGPVTLADVWTQVLGLFWGDDPRPVRQAIAELSARWVQVLDVPAGVTTPVELTADEVARRMRGVFPGERARWPHLGVHSPDLQIVAPSVEAIDAGEYEVVLGELHACLSSLDMLFLDWTTPGTESVRDRVNSGVGSGRPVPLFPVGWRRNSGRFVPTSLGAGDRLIGFTRAPVADRTLVDPAVAITLAEDDGTLFATTPGGVRHRIPELLGVLISMVSADAFKIGLDRPHSPRLTIDGLVVFRESWKLPVAAIELPANADRYRDYLAVRAWVAREGLPDHVFVKFPEETKPALFDLTSPALVLAFANLVRAALRHGQDAVLGVSEPLPHPRQSWLPDADGERYVSEIRLQISREPAP